MPAMRHTFPTLLLWVAAGMAAAADIPVPATLRESLAVDEAALARAGLEISWRLALPMRPAEQVTRVSLLDEHLYALTDRGELFAIRAESGLVRWQRPIIRPGDVLFPLTHAAAEQGLGPVVATTPAWVAILDRETGREIPFVDPQTGQKRENLSLDTAPNTSMVADANYLYGAMVNMQFVAYQRKDGFVRWTIGAGATASIAPRLLPGRVLFASDKGRFVMVSTEGADIGMVVWKDQVATAPLERVIGLTSRQREKLWPKEATTTPIEPLFVSPTHLIFAAMDQIVYSIDPRTGPVEGQVRWRHGLTRRPSEGPAVVGDLVFQEDPGQGLLAIDRQSGRLRWLLPRGRRLLARAADAAYALGTDGLLVVADAATGAIRDRIPGSGARFAPTNPANDAVFLADRGGRIVCIRKSGLKPLKSSDFLPSPPMPATTRAAAGHAASSAPAETPEAPAATRGESGVTVEGDVLRSHRE